jgi:hypothetical protein
LQSAVSSRHGTIERPMISYFDSLMDQLQQQQHQLFARLFTFFFHIINYSPSDRRHRHLPLDY